MANDLAAGPTNARLLRSPGWMFTIGLVLAAIDWVRLDNPMRSEAFVRVVFNRREDLIAYLDSIEANLRLRSSIRLRSAASAPRLGSLTIPPSADWFRVCLADREPDVLVLQGGKRGSHATICTSQRRAELCIYFGES